ncbi:MAG: hypothetical protein P8J87_12620 [Verrucomicrobiales bacterium]|nr:hypothetical protein [Verrucomicrobiales bacterium]
MRELDYNLAGSYIDGGIHGEAILILERLYEKWPDEHRFGLKLAYCYEALGRPGVVEGGNADVDPAAAGGGGTGA